MIWRFESLGYIYIVKQPPYEPYAFLFLSFMARQVGKANRFSWLYAIAVWVSSVDKAGFDVIGSIGGVA